MNYSKTIIEFKKVIILNYFNLTLEKFDDMIKPNNHYKHTDYINHLFYFAYRLSQAHVRNPQIVLSDIIIDKVLNGNITTSDISDIVFNDRKLNPNKQCKIELYQALNDSGFIMI